MFAFPQLMVYHITIACWCSQGTINHTPFFFFPLAEQTKTTDGVEGLLGVIWGWKLGRVAKVNKQIVGGPLPPNCPKPSIQSEAVALWIRSRAELTGGELPHTSHRRIHPRSRRRLLRNPTSPRPLHPADNQIHQLGRTRTSIFISADFADSSSRKMPSSADFHKPNPPSF